TAPDLMQRLSVIGAGLLGETLSQLDTLTPRPQHHDEATFAPLLTKSDGLVDWSRDAAHIERSVRGFQPWPSAYTHHKTHRLIIWKAVAEASALEARPGEISFAHGDDLLV